MKATDIPLQHIKAERARRSLARWSTYTNPNYQIAGLHQRLIAALERVERGECKRLMVFMPPRMGKTEAVSINFPSYFLGRNPDSRVIMASYGASLAYVNSRRARDLLATYGQEVFGNTVAQNSKAVDEWNIEGHRGGLFAVGVDGPAVGKGADLFIIDDPVKDMADALSETQRESKKQWYRGVARTRLHPGARVVVLQTRWHEDDLSGWLLNEARNGGEQWEVLSLPMVADDGALLWPERYPQSEVDAIRKAVGSVVWESQYQQNPVSDEGGMFKRVWWQRYSKLPHVQDEWLASLDCTFKDTSKSDFVVCQVWLRREARYYLVWQCRRRLDFNKTCELVKRVKAMFPKVQRFLIEDKANGPAVINTLKPMVPGLIAIDPGAKGKEARAASVTPWVESGNVFIPESPEGWESDEPGNVVDLFVNELAGFPKSKHDDQVDALSQALNYWQSPTMSATVMPLQPRNRPKGLDM